MLRTIEYGDFDLITTFFTLQHGKVAALAKNARKSVRRFGGSLELFSLVDIVYAYGKKKGRLPILSESTVVSHFENIRGDITKTAFASFWAELAFMWTEDGQPQEELFNLLVHALGALHKGGSDDKQLNLLFALRFLEMSGLAPNLEHCSVCNTKAVDMVKQRICFDHARGGIVCPKCGPPKRSGPVLAMGTIKQLMWLINGDLATAGRVKLSQEALTLGRELVEGFVPFHLGREPKSLSFLRQLRRRHF